MFEVAWVVVVGIAATAFGVRELVMWLSRPRAHASVKLSVEEALLAKLREQYVRGDLSFIEHGDRVMEVLTGKRTTAALNDRQEFAESLSRVRYYDPVSSWQRKAAAYADGVNDIKNERRRPRYAAGRRPVSSPGVTVGGCGTICAVYEPPDEGLDRIETERTWQ